MLCDVSRGHPVEITLHPAAVIEQFASGQQLMDES
jgi:hypothetical protein